MVQGGDRRIAAGAAALAALGLLAFGALAGLAVEAARDPSGAAGAFDLYLLAIARFTLWQAMLSTLLSVIPALFVARALSRHPRFPGRGLIVRLFAVPLALPQIVAALGILALLGRAGWFSDVWTLLGAGRWPGIYGLSGILVAHVFFNLPLATRLFLGALEAIPADQWRLAAQLGMGGRAAFRLIEWPALRAALPGVAGLVFMLCATSFTVVLTLGGGPGATTLEVAIYQALRFDFDPARAVALTLVQIILTAALVALIGLAAPRHSAFSLAPAFTTRRFDHPRAAETALNGLLVAMALVLVAAPILAVALSGLQADLARLAGERSVQRATITSLVLAALAAMLSVALSLALVGARKALETRRWGERPGLFEYFSGSGAALILVLPPIVIGSGWFILLRNRADIFALAPVMIVAVNAAMAMPFAMRALGPAYDEGAGRHDRICAALGIAGWNRFRLVDWPTLRRPLATAFAFAMALSLGDLGVIALFGSDQVQTLPYLLLARMGAYRTADAAGLALMLGALCFALMVVADRLAGRTAR